MCDRQRSGLTIFSGVTGDNSGFWTPAELVPALNLNLVGHKRGRVPHDKGRPFDHVLPPLVLHPQLPVAHLVLKAGAVLLDGQQRLQQDTQKAEEPLNSTSLVHLLSLLPPS